jgi:AcrR family transcriptional regulator
MAKRMSAARRPRAGGRARDPAERLIQAALDIAESEGWSRVRLSRAAARARVPLAEALQLFPSRAALLSGYFRAIDRAVLAAGAGAGDEGSARDRLFDVLMRRFDALNARKRAVAAVCRASLLDPLETACAMPRLLRSMAWMLEAAGLGAAGWRGRLRAKGLALIYMNAFRVWLADDSKDMAKTMAALDRGLRWAEGLLQLIAVRPGRPRADGGAGAG